jgi:hypothetical protein
MSEAATRTLAAVSAPPEPVLTPAQEREFDRHAVRLGHDPVRLRGGTELISYPVIPSVAALRALPAATPAQRAARQRVFFNPVIAARRRLGQGVHDRLEAAVFADGAIDPADEARAVAHFPFPTRVLSVRQRTVRADECWDLSVRGGHWGLDDRDDIINVVNVGVLHLEPGATVVARGNLLVLIVQRLICVPGQAAAPYQLAVLPTPFPVDSDTGPADGACGPAGLSGRGGPDGVGAPVVPTWLGDRLAGPLVPGAADGRDGSAGTAGGDGGRGRTGGASKIAEITIGDLAGSLTFLAAAGRGGDGGPGGDGAPGGQGGDGAPGQRTVRGVLRPGRGGHGGDGGHGGAGGRGGHGGISSNVFVSLPPGQVGRVRVLAHPAPGGCGGAGGAGGHGGAGGRDGLPAPGQTFGATPAAAGPVPVSSPPAAFRPDGLAGQQGAAGSQGRHGRPRSAPPVYLNERAVTPMPSPADIPAPATPVRSLDTRLAAIPQLNPTGSITGRGEAR